MSCVSLDTEVRKLKPIELHRLGIILSVSDNWKKLMASVPKQENISKFSSEHIEMIEQAAHKYNRNAAEIFLDEWGTMGKTRATLRLLLDLLVKAELFRAADYVACDILKQERPQRPDYGPIASVDISDAAIYKILQEQICPKETFDDSLVLESSSKLEVNKMYLDDKTFDNLQEAVNKNALEATDSVLNCEKSVGAVNGIVSDLMKFSMADTCKATDKHMAYTVVSVAEEQLPLPIIGGSEDSSSIRDQYCQEVASQELPVFLNGSVQSTLSNEISSAHLPVCLDNYVQPTTSTKEISSEYLPVFLENTVLSTTLSNIETSSDNPLYLKR